MYVGKKYKFSAAVYYVKVFECIYISQKGDAVLEDSEGSIRIVPSIDWVLWREVK